MEPGTGLQREDLRGITLKVLALLGAGLLVYLPVLGGDWIWDDDLEVLHNPALRSTSSLAAAWRGDLGADYLPVKVSAQWLFFRIAGTNSAAWHVLNLVLHLANALMVWRLFVRLGIRAGWLGGLLFALHPVMVMSVAWISEFKNTLSLAFLLAAMLAYIRFVEHPRPRDYFVALGCFALAAISKGAVVMFPVIILLYLWWKNSRITRRDLLITVPFFAISLAAGLLTIHFQHTRAMESALSDTGLGLRLLIAGQAILFYFSKILFPAGLLPIYPRWEAGLPGWMEIFAWVVTGVAIALAWRQRRTWGRAVLLGLGFFLINLVPVLGVIPMAFSQISWVSDHLIYLPALGILGLVSAGAGGLWEKFPMRRPLMRILAVVMLAWLGLSSASYSALFEREIGLWTYTLQRNPEAWLAHIRLGVLRLERGEYEEAEFHQREAIRLVGAHREAARMTKTQAVACANLSVVLEARQDLDGAVAALREASRLQPQAPDYPVRLGRIFLGTGRSAEAKEQFEKALKLDPDFEPARKGIEAVEESRPEPDGAP
jgi:hypothetical protein